MNRRDFVAATTTATAALAFLTRSGVADASVVADGMTDDSAALQSLLNDSFGSAPVVLPAGTVLIQAPVEFPEGAALIGDDAGTVLLLEGDGLLVIPGAAEISSLEIMSEYIPSSPIIGEMGVDIKENATLVLVDVNFVDLLGESGLALEGEVTLTRV